MSWSANDLKELKRLALKRKYWASEIAEKLGKKPGAVRYKLHQLNMMVRPDGRKMGEWNQKYEHIKKKAMTYFVKHSYAETCKKFGLTSNELKSLITNGYRDPSLLHLRKDTRRKDPWDLKEMLEVLRYSGVLPREEIGRRLNRAGARNIKERVRSWNTGTKWLNGMPYSWARSLWPEVKIPAIKTDAGPGLCKFVIVPWHDAFILSEQYSTPDHVQIAIRSMAKFSEYIHGTNSKAAIKRRFAKALKRPSETR